MKQKPQMNDYELHYNNYYYKNEVLSDSWKVR